MFPLGQDFDATSWTSLEPVTNELISREIKFTDELSIFSRTSRIWQNMSQRRGPNSIGMTCDTESEKNGPIFLNL